MVKRLISDEAGTSAIEYAIIGALVSAFIILALMNMTGMVQVLYVVSATLVDNSI